MGDPSRVETAPAGFIQNTLTWTDQPATSMTKEAEGRDPLGLLPMAQALWTQTIQGAQLGVSSEQTNKDMMLNAVACCYSALQLVLPTEYELRFRIMLANIFIRHCPSKHDEASEQLQKCLTLMNAVIPQRIPF